MPVDPNKYELDAYVSVDIELDARRTEALRIYEPLPWQEEVHLCRTTEVMVSGGNRSGKSCCGFAEDARALCGCDPHHKYPERDGILVIVAENWKAIGMVVYPALFKSAFQMIRDEATGKWRAYRPWDPADVARKSESKAAPPLIPKRLIVPKSMSFLNKKERHLSSFEMVNGWKCFVFSSEGEIPMGFQADRIHLDEDIKNPKWIEEMQARLSDRKGVMWWTATPTRDNHAMIDMDDRAEKQADEVAKGERQTADVVKFTFDFTKNPHIEEDEKRKRLEAWAAAGEDVLNQRAYGILGGSTTLMYPNFSMAVHGMERDRFPNHDVPKHWCRYAYIDPGHAVTAVLFAAVPPSEEYDEVGEDFVLLYKELYLKQCNAEIFGREMAAACMGESLWAFVLDVHGGRLRDIGAGVSLKRQFSAALKRHNCASLTTGHSFIDACDDISARTEAARIMLHVRPAGTPYLRVLEGSLPNLIWEVKRYTKQVDAKGHVTDKPRVRGFVHQCQNLEYMAAHNPSYHQPRHKTVERNLQTYIREKQQQRNQLLGVSKSSVFLGPGG